MFKSTASNSRRVNLMSSSSSAGGKPSTSNGKRPRIGYSGHPNAMRPSSRRVGPKSAAAVGQPANPLQQLPPRSRVMVKAVIAPKEEQIEELDQQVEDLRQRVEDNEELEETLKSARQELQQAIEERDEKENQLDEMKHMENGLRQEYGQLLQCRRQLDEKLLNERTNLASLAEEQAHLETTIRQSEDELDESRQKNQLLVRQVVDLDPTATFPFSL